MTKTKLNITNKSQEVSPFPAGGHKAATNRRENMTTQDIINTNDPQKSSALERSVKYFTEELKPVSPRQPLPQSRCGSRHIDVWFA